MPEKKNGTEENWAPPNLSIDELINKSWFESRDLPNLTVDPSAVVEGAGVECTSRYGGYLPGVVSLPEELVPLTLTWTGRERAALLKEESGEDSEEEGKEEKDEV